MQPLRHSQTLPVPPQELQTSPRPNRYLNWVATATNELRGAIWNRSDEWRNQSSIDSRRISASEHNKPFFEDLKWKTGVEMDEISAFMDRHPTSYRSTNDKFYLEAFCKGASFLLDNSNIHALQNFHLAHIDEPKAWVSDRNYWLSQDGAAVSTWYGNVLGRHDLYKVLQNEVRKIEESS